VTRVRQLAECNVALMRDEPDSPAMRGFVAALAPVQAVAEASPGFVWRLPSGHDRRPVTVDDGAGGLLVVNVSVWRSYESLHRFTYRTSHGGFVRRRSEWFLPTPPPSTVLWWVAPGTRPDAAHALRRLAHLRAHGPTPQAFGLRRRFDPDGLPVTTPRG
jgi:hypothetical protein